MPKARGRIGPACERTVYSKLRTLPPVPPHPQLLPSGKANAHMVVALDAVRHMLSPQVQDRFKTQLKPRGDLAGRRAMREILRAVGPDVWKVLGARAPSSQAGSQAGGAAQPPLDCRSLRPQAEVHWCGSPAGQKPSAVQACE